MRTNYLLTKTAYLTYGQCGKALWLSEQEPHLARPPDPATQRRLRTGQAVDKLARQQFPDGRLIPYRAQPAEMAALTAEALAQGRRTLFQATFLVDDLLVKVDILQPTAAGWQLIEVKSTTSYKPEEHLPDVAFQLYVLQRAGLTVSGVQLLHLNRECRYPDLSNLFTSVDLTAAAAALLPDLAADVAMMRSLLAGADSPAVAVGRHCTRPRECAFHAHCWQDVDGWTIYDIPYLKQPVEQQLEADGIFYVADIPPGRALGERRATAFVNRINQKEKRLDRPAIRAELERLVYPLYFFDFETIDYAVPIYDGCRPYQQTPFQYSCHVLTADGRLSHYDYLHTGADDPRPALVASLLNDIGPEGHLVVYHAPFERGILQELAAQFPAQADRLLAMAGRLWDQLVLCRQHVHHYGFGNSYSLKSVLPVMAPKLGYDALAVQNGAQAQVVWEEMIQTAATAVKERLATQLREYCHLDTLAMVAIHRALQAAVS
jgi:hypothetical protein